MTKPIIGITANHTVLKNDSYHPFPISYSPEGFKEAITLAGGIPILIPINDPELACHYLSLIDGLLLTGGQDVSPCFYGEEPRLVMGETSPERDASELALFNEAVAKGKAILGVCRGMQLINVALGGTLYQDLQTEADISIQHVQKAQPQFVTHCIDVKAGTYLSQLVQTNTRVNSVHHQAVKDLGKHLTVGATSSDGIIESVEWIDDSHSIIGVQWHPELTFARQNDSLDIFNDLIKRAKA